MPLLGDGKRLFSSPAPNESLTGEVAAAGEAGASSTAAISAFAARLGEEGGAGVGSTIVDFVKTRDVWNKKRAANKPIPVPNLGRRDPI